jgi:protein dithiol oxidoreductase (disulfide-forming)
MSRRNCLKLLAAAPLLGASWSALAAVTLDPAKDYSVLSPAQAGGSNGQIEVLEFFSYGCPHCAAFDPKLSQWRAAQGKDVVFQRVPVSFGRKEWGALGRLHLTLRAMGLAEKFDGKVFDAVHKSYLKLEDEAVRNDWLGKQGVDVKKFNDTWRSFGIESQVKRADQMAETYKVDSVPMLVIDGKFIPRDGGVAGEDAGHSRVLVNATELVARVRASKAMAKK